MLEEERELVIKALYLDAAGTNIHALQKIGQEVLDNVYLIVITNIPTNEITENIEERDAITEIVQLVLNVNQKENAVREKWSSNVKTTTEAAAIARMHKLQHHVLLVRELKMIIGIIIMIFCLLLKNSFKLLGLRIKQKFMKDILL
ncbi:hypothetical protein JYU34_010001 [Plutella xylostella]|uniref:Uncharacterized protein n=1 Tax=Plutella xylostella TaxID=51655 RepID=A0ABQ7QHJ1_PLUXY|nr:hypothetical protein JYU34_010001 [Plutella xylostella]